MYCPQCGTQNPDDAMFCSGCGAALQTISGNQNQIRQNPEPNRQNSYQQKPAAKQAANPVYETQAASADQIPSYSNSGMQQAGGQDPFHPEMQNYGGQNGYQPNYGGQNYGGQNGYQPNYGGQNYGGQNGYQPNYGGQNYGGQNSYQPNYGGQNGYQPNYGGQNYGDQSGYQPDYSDWNDYPGNDNTPDYSGMGRSGKNERSITPFVVLGEAVLLVAGILILLLVPGRMFQPEYVAKRYFTALVNGKYGSAFSMLNLEESDFVNADYLQDYYRDYDFSKVESVSVEEREDDESEDDKEHCSVRILFQEEEDDEEYYFDLQLAKADKKKYFFFPDWYVEDEGMILKDSVILTSEDIVVKLNGTSLKDYLTETTEDGNKRYEIPEAMVGAYEYTAQAPGRKETTAWIGSAPSANIWDTSLPLEDAVVEGLQDLAAANMQVIYASAAKGGSFSEISGLLSTDPQYQENLQADYQYLTEFFERNSIVEIRFNRIVTECEICDSHIKVSFSYEMDYNTYDSSVRADVMKTSANTGSYDVFFTYENEKWVQTTLGCCPLSF